MKKVLCLFAVIGALFAVGCGDDSDDSGSAGGGNAGAQCEDMSTTFNCSKLETCCTNGPACWYNATKSGTTKKFDCAGSNCQQAATDAIAYCQ